MNDFKWKANGISDVGIKRQNNEDSVGWQIHEEQQWLCAVVADGMGGHASGEVASSMARTLFLDGVEWLTTKHRLAPLDDDALIEHLVELVNQVHATISKHAEENPHEKGMGTTLVALLFLDEKSWLVNIGDSRCYRLRDSELSQLSHDHTVVQSWIDKGQMSESVAERSPYRNMLTQALGAEEPISPEVTMIDLTSSDKFLLCSDGLTNCLSPAFISDTLQSEASLDSATQILLKETLSEGAPDNVSIILVSQ